MALVAGVALGFMTVMLTGVTWMLVMGLMGSWQKPRGQPITQLLGPMFGLVVTGLVVASIAFMVVEALKSTGSTLGATVIVLDVHGCGIRGVGRLI